MKFLPCFIDKNLTARHSGRSPERNVTLDMSIGLIDFCRTGQPGEKFRFEINTLKVSFANYGKMRIQKNWLTC